jgi:pimeloyl-ACP methyl ester carboxylesterase
VPYVRSGDRRIHYHEAGAGVPVVLVHSSGLSSRQWHRIGEILSKSHRVIAPDLLGAGESDGVDPDAPFELDEDVNAVDAVLDTLGECGSGGAFHLVGHSYGGFLALSLARRDPSRVRSVTVFEPVAFGVLYSSQLGQTIREVEAIDADGTFFDDATGGDERWMERFVDWWQGEGAFRALPERSRSLFLSQGRKVYQEVRELGQDRTPHQAYESLAMPTLVLSGERSPAPARKIAAVLASVIPDATLEEIAGAGHMAPLTHARAVGERIASFLRRVDA